MAFLALLRVALSHTRRRPLQTGLLILGVALGVAVVVAIDLANNSALAAFRISTEAITGRSTHRVVGGPLGLDESLYTRLRTELDLRASAPMVEGSVTLRALPGETLTLLGVDPFAEPPFRSFLAAGPGAAGEGGSSDGIDSAGQRDGAEPADSTSRAGRSPESVPERASGEGSGKQVPEAGGTSELAAFFTTPGAVFISEDLASRAGATLGERLMLDGGGRSSTVTVVGILRPEDGLSRRALDALVIADISSAQEILGKVGRLDRIDLLLPEDPAVRQAMLAQVRAVLPPGVEIEAAGDEQSTVEGMTRAFRLNLTALSLLALLVGTFLIFNTVRFSVVQRRPVIATLRALGVTRREIFGMVLGEAAVLGAIGSLIGLGLGVVLGRGAVALVTQTVSDLYFVVNVRGVEVPWTTLVRGGLLGVASSIGAAWLPALEATGVPPITALRRSEEEGRTRRAVPWLTLGAGLSALAGFGLLAVPGAGVALGFAGLAAVIFAFALAAPAVTLGFMILVRPVTERLFGPIGRMAPRGVTRSLSRTAVAIAALMVSVCVSIGVSLMVDSFRTTVNDWLASTLRADVFVTSAAGQSTRTAGTLDPALPGELAKLPEVARLATAHTTGVRSPELGPVDLLVVSEDIAGEGRRFVASRGDAATRWQALLGGAAIISEPFARRHHLGMDDHVSLVTDHGPQDFPIAGVFYDYGADRGFLILADPVYRANWRDSRITSAALFLKPGVDADAYARTLKAELNDRVEGGVHVQSTRGLRAEVLKVFDRAFAITTALQLLAILVAFAGVLSSLMALQLERSREHATLRAVGMTEGQLGGLALLETGLVGLVAGFLSWPAGLTLALLLVYVINRRSFGWTIQFQLDPAVFLRALAVALVAALLAGLYPAWRLRQGSIVRGLREE